MFPTAGPLGFPIGTASRMLVVKVDLRLKRSMSASGPSRHIALPHELGRYRSKADIGSSPQGLWVHALVGSEKAADQYSAQ